MKKKEREKEKVIWDEAAIPLGISSLTAHKVPADVM